MSDQLTMRDTFAAAALNGWLASQQTVINQYTMARKAYEYADAMLLERERTNHDAAPAAKEADAQPSSAKRADGFTGVTQEPVAWAVADPKGRPRVLSFSMEDAFLNRKSASEKVFQLYSQPQTTLTDAERKALEWAARLAKYSLGLAEPYDALSGLLERTA